MFLGFENVTLNRLAFIKFMKDKENAWCLLKTNMDITQKQKKIKIINIMDAFVIEMN